MPNPYAIGIDLGGSSVKAIAVRPSGEALARTVRAFPPDVPLAWAETIRQIIATFERSRRTPARWIGLSAPGLAARDQRSIAYMPARLEGLEHLDWTTYLRRRARVPVLNDAHAALVGEAWLGSAKGFQNVFLLTLGTGVGGAILSGGRLMRGTIGRAGHLGHVSIDAFGKPDIVGTPGSLEGAIGNCTIVERSGRRFTSTHELIAAVKRKDPVAEKIWMESVRKLAVGICSLINVLDPEAVIIGGGIARAGRALFDPLRKLLAEMEWRPGGHATKIIPARLGEFAGAFGAAHQALARRRSGTKDRNG